MMMAGLDGIQNKIDPGAPLDKDIYSLSPEELRGVPQMPGSLEEALGALEGEWLVFERERERNPIRMRPAPYEF